MVELLISSILQTWLDSRCFSDYDIENGRRDNDTVDCLYIVIPAYNEEENIDEVIQDWYPLVESDTVDENSRLLIIDDGSQDATLQQLQKAAEEKSRLLVLHKENGGHGSTIYEGYQYALRAGADYIFQTDSDRQTLPSEFRSFWERRADADILIGNRQHRKDGISRIITSRVLRLVVLGVFHVSVQDANTPYRLMQAKALEEELVYVPQGYFLCNVILSTAFVKHGKRCLYLPITFLPREKGKNSIDLKKIIGIGWRAVGEFYQIAGKM